MVMRELVGYRWNKIGYELIIVEAGEGFIILFIMCVKFSLMKSLKKKKIWPTTHSDNRLFLK